SLLEKAVYENSREIPGSVRYSVKRYLRPQSWAAEDTGFLSYRYHPTEPQKNALELRFCIAGNMYCRHTGAACNQCKVSASPNCTEKQECLDALSFVFTTSLLEQFVKSKISTDALSDNLLSFKHTTSFTKEIPLCNRTRSVLEGLLNHNYTDTLENIYVNAQTQMLLLYSLNCMTGEQGINTIGCKFLANEADREKISKARTILIQHIGEPITIKELSRKVAINECYLKKGFKEMFGTTIFDFYQSQRMEHAKYLLYEKGLSVTDVSVLLGYSSISHFSTAFKKHTGLKPCELLLR
ncbi:MAG TPA: AraC family transcriptional regulator, partial [Chitinophagaceae bacterium]|nr:AraC family transcriptional regulator [Chitinophagaceae bacterium]